MNTVSGVRDSLGKETESLIHHMVVAEISISWK